MTQKRLRIGYAALVFFAWYCATSVVLWWNYVPYLGRFKTTTELQTYALSMLTLNESTLQDVQQLIDNETFGQMSCYFLDENGRVGPTGDRLTCHGPMERFGWWRYYITFHFEDTFLQGVMVFKGYIGL
jgi:hypothetical protein